MKVNKSTLIVSVALVSLFGLSLIFSQISWASTATEIINGFSKTGGAAGYDINPTSGAPKKEFVAAWSNYINGFATIFGAFFMVLVIYGGWLWMSAQGKEEQVEQAKKIIIGAVIGLAVVIGGRLIAELVITYLGQTVVF
ncbi:MAG: hypothetical protein A2729_01610 [Candidatus Buchananbacteria bacterium RIFCSPHIGHO2_01_FULL_39_14]|uniref:Uncharacterized protein n=2 Tax=Candidatus Buchananiibacteriota TaxID=1817903 RepID=A0A1G1YQK4_9BACT|nr:MAG: hypothetical protein A2729_01610 [Candidatus Buchananbacteria bacterium RIFCSPHIGHO2_01_FULL_39_14]OGY54086.1 MAG: hypothetical protein A2912_01805 [Candidatus Buchananbacteria bacterium RIFCSPLOWO2_01_FULL_40_23b]